MPADILQQLGEPEVSVKTRFLKLRIIPAPIVLRKAIYSFARHSSTEEPRHHRGIDNHAYAVIFAERQDLIFYVRVDKRVGWLKCVNAVDLQRALQLFDI